MVLELQRGGHEIDRKLEAGKIQLFKGSEPMLGGVDPADLSSESEGEDGGIAEGGEGMLLELHRLSERHSMSVEQI